MCFVRKGMDYLFTQHELGWLDDLMPETNKREKEDENFSELDDTEMVRFQLLSYLRCVLFSPRISLGIIL